MYNYASGYQTVLNRQRELFSSNKEKEVLSTVSQMFDSHINSLTDKIRFCRRWSKSTMSNLFIERKTIIEMMVFRFFCVLFLYHVCITF